MDIDAQLHTVSGSLADPARAAHPALTFHDGRFLRFGTPHQVLSGSLHYFRVHPAQWADRMQRLVDLGLNTVDTYIPWNFHRPRLSEAADFTGWRDIGSFLEKAAEAGLDVILRPGPYICAEWSNGGLPAWLTARGVALRSSDPGFRAPVEEWFGELLPRLTPYQAAQGGPVVAVQVENEFGSFGDDSDYLRWLDDLLVRSGVTELRYSADGPTDVMLDGGSIPGILTAATLGSKPGQARELLRSRRDGEPFFVAEFWNGWFDHWGHPHHIRDAADAARTVAEIVEDAGSVSIYMAHGGTNFGLWAGANDVDGELRPTTTSYDSDAPIAEDGRFTEKFAAVRRSLSAAAEPGAPAVRHLAPRTVDTLRGESLLASLEALATGPRVASSAPLSFEALGMDAGLVAYRSDVLLPDRDVVLGFERVADRALVFLDGVAVGTITASGTLEVRGHGRPSQLDVVVENLGRVNYGPHLGEHKGLLGPVLVERRAVQGWHSLPIELDRDAAALEELVSGSPDDDAAGISWASFDLDEPLDAHLALPGYDKGFVWVNGFLLGRYWGIGPQQTLYVPGPLLQTGANSVVILELHRSGDRIELRDEPELGPTESYVEEF